MNDSPFFHGFYQEKIENIKKRGGHGEIWVFIPHNSPRISLRFHKDMGRLVSVLA